MRTLLFFDLPSVSAKDKREYRRFVKVLKMNGFVMLQESVYTMLSINQQYADSRLKVISDNLPSFGNVLILTITEKQFSNMKILLGEYETDVVVSSERTLIF